MSKENTIVARKGHKGSIVQVSADGSEQILENRTDWARLRQITDQEVESAAFSDPDALPLTLQRQSGMQRTPRARIIRRALGLTQEEFATRYRIPLGTLRDWEQGRVAPDQTARAYLQAIAGNAAAVEDALQAGQNNNRD